MKKLIPLLLALFPIITLANNSSLSFAPPPGDYSVIFLGNLFGVVDGVLHGTGSQMMGAIFSVFNAAVLALGGIVIMYTLIVSTMNTAHEGQMLGQKWSSIWVPVRATMGLTLLIPKASGYCLMQIFVMWVVVQGVGAADKVWDAALGYLNRGGAIIKGQADPTKELFEGPPSSNRGLATGAYKMLSGEICMLGLQYQLNYALETIKKDEGIRRITCDKSPEIRKFCDSTVPNFISSVNFISIQDKNSGGGALAPTSFEAKMPYFEDFPYSLLNGVCGIIKWNKFSVGGVNIAGLKQADLDTAAMSRAIALQQMYLDLAAVAQVMVDNNPGIHKSNSTNTSKDNFSDVAVQQFGVPLTAMGEGCANGSSPCIGWGSLPESSGATLFNGTEFKGAMLDYNGIMLPSLTLIEQNKNSSAAGNERSFIKDANSKGWIMAGSYFFKLVKLNQSATNGYNSETPAFNNLVDENIGFEKNSSTDVQVADTLSKAFELSGDKCVGEKFAILCELLGKTKDSVKDIIGLISGFGDGTPTMPAKISNIDFKSFDYSNMEKLKSSTAAGFALNSMLLKLPGQPGEGGVNFADKIDFEITWKAIHLDRRDFDCGLALPFMPMCMGWIIGNFIYNLIMVPVFNLMMDLIKPVIDKFLELVLAIPIRAIARIFKTGVHIISQPGVNPIIALANMGTYYINFSMNFFINMIGITITAMLTGPFGLVVVAIIAIISPLLFSFIAIMLDIGFITAYYIPLLPYMIFTFGSIAWLMAVIEAMVAAPIVALGVTHPEGEGALGKGEQAIMILMNVFLRPSMMIIGYIAGIAMTFVSVWIINAGFDEAISIIQNTDHSPSGLIDNIGRFFGSFMKIANKFATNEYGFNSLAEMPSEAPDSGYHSWAGTFGYFFAVITYTVMYLIAVQKSFSLIASLPDKVLRWIGGQAENIGTEAAGWGEEVKGKIEKTGGQVASAAVQSQKAAVAEGKDAIDKAKAKASGSAGGAAG